MIDKVTFFENDIDLMRLVGVKERDRLWDFGFDLDDMDFGFRVKEEWSNNFEGPYYQSWILERMNSHCVGYKHLKHCGYHYYILYHS